MRLETMKGLKRWRDISSLLFCAALLSGLPGCGEGGESEGAITTPGSPIDVTVPDDPLKPGDSQTPPDADDSTPDEGDAVSCPPADAEALTLRAWNALNETVTAGEQDDFRLDGYRIDAVLDARAGGTEASSSRSFRYVSLDDAAPLELSDVEASDSKDWAVAFRRTAIRINSGQSGPGGVRMARIGETRFEDLHAPPTDVIWADDVVEWVLKEEVDTDSDTKVEVCRLDRDPFGLPFGAVNKLNIDTEPSGSWYDYGGPGGVSPVPDTVYLLELEDGAVWKMSFDGFADGVWSLRWELLLGECAAPDDVDEADVMGRETALFSYDTDSVILGDEDDGWSAVLQASVGGYGGAYAMTYLDLRTGTVRPHNDLDAYSAEDWSIGLRRQGLRINSGASGVGAVEIARIDQPFEDVIAPPAGLRWETDELQWRWTPSQEGEPTCAMATEPMGPPQTAIHRVNLDRQPMQSWHSYAGGVIAPYPDVTYLVRHSDGGEVYKLSIDNYAVDSETGEVSWALRWKAL